MTTDAPVARRDRKKAQTRKALLQVALRLISERGIYGTRIEDITERSDLGKGAFYNYFPSKSALVATLVGEGVELLCRDYLEELKGDAAAHERVAAVIGGHEAFFTEHPVFVVLFHQARGLAKVDPPGGELRKVFIEYLRRIGDLLVSTADREPATAAERMDLAAVILGSIAGYRSFRIAAGLDFDTRALTSALTAGILGALPSGRAGSGEPGA